MNVLVGIATYPTEPAVYPATQASIDALDLGAEQSIRYYGGDRPGCEPHDNLVDKHNAMRRDVLEGGYDALLTIEADMIVPPDALQMLAEVDADVVYGAYVSRQHLMVLCFPQINGYTGRSISANPDTYRAQFGWVVPSEGVGFGCTLIRRHVLEAVEFRRNDPKARKRGFADDWCFALDVKAAGFRQAHHLGVLCGHIDHATGDVLWPDAAAPQLWRVDKADRPAPVVVPDVPRSYRVRRQLVDERRYYQPGEIVTLGADVARTLLDRRAVEEL